MFISFILASSKIYDGLNDCYQGRNYLQFCISGFMAARLDLDAS